MKLRVNGVDENDTPLRIRKHFQQYGKVEEVALYCGEDVSYAVVTMPDDDAQKAREKGEIKWKDWRRLQITVANWYRGQWLSPNWRPPKENCR